LFLTPPENFELPWDGKLAEALKKQLQYLKRNWSHIDHLIESGATLESLSQGQYKKLLVGQEIYRQQAWMYKLRGFSDLFSKP
jgi:hypothetical protein